MEIINLLILFLIFDFICELKALTNLKSQKNKFKN